jgi:hypothetical protein
MNTEVPAGARDSMARSALAANPDAIASQEQLRMDRYFFIISLVYLYRFDFQSHD